VKSVAFCGDPEGKRGKNSWGGGKKILKMRELWVSE